MVFLHEVTDQIFIHCLSGLFYDQGRRGKQSRDKK